MIYAEDDGFEVKKDFPKTEIFEHITTKNGGHLGFVSAFGNKIENYWSDQEF